MEPKRQGKTTVAKVLKKKTTMINKHGAILSQNSAESVADDLKQRQAARARRLGLPVKV